jgi:glutaredoxin-related protein
MKKILTVIFILIFSTSAFANKNKNTWDYPLIEYSGWVIKGSENHFKFQSNLREDKDVLKEFKNNKNTGIISYLLFENDKIVIDVSDIPKKTSSGDYIIDGLLPSHSMGKSLVSYVTGHAICEGYIDSVNVKLNDWPLIKDTLYENSILLDLLNMKGGDQKWVGERRNVGSDNRIKGEKKEENVNVIGLEKVMNKYLKDTEKSKLIYNYSALTTNVIMNYVKFKAGDDWDKLLHKVFNEHVKVKNSVQFQRSNRKYARTNYVSARYSFYANRYDYLRIAKTMMEDWHNDTCAGKYLKTIFKNRIKKKDKVKHSTDVGLYTKSYGGQIHFDLFGIKKERKILGLSGFAGQNILIDLDNKRIIVISSLYRNYNWKKIVYNKIKNNS